MKRDMLQQKYQLPTQILDMYDAWQRDELMGDTTEYTSEDIASLQAIMVLKNSGFSIAEIKKYLETSNNEQDRRLDILNKKRQEKLQVIHSCEKQISSLDYLRFQLRKDL